jgi:hypothetical protein
MVWQKVCLDYLTGRDLSGLAGYFAFKNFIRLPGTPGIFTGDFSG